MAPSDEMLQRMLRHGDFLRRLARGLVRDTHRADDVVQEAYLAALKRPPPHAGNLRGWLARVVRNLSLRASRTEARLQARHRRRTGPRTVESTGSAAARLETQRHLVAAVRALPEPYLSVVVARFYDGWGPAEIARRTNTPPRTVETRLRRALVRLRETLDESQRGGRRAWTAALLPLVAPPERAAVVLGGALMAKRIVIVFLILLVGGGALWWMGDRSPVREPRRGNQGSRVASDGTSSSQRPEDSNGAVDPSTPGVLRIHGRVLDDVDGAPVPGAAVSAFDYVRGTVLRTVTDRDGAFAFEPSGDHAFRLLVRSEPHTARALPYVRPGRDPLVILVGAGGGIEGRVIGPDGAAVPGASVTAVRLLFPEEETWNAHVALYHQAVPDALHRIARVETGSDGSFNFERLAPAKYVLIAGASGYGFVTANGGEGLDRHQGIEVKKGERTPIEIVLPRLAPVRFRVTDAEHGRPVRGVRFTVAMQIGRRHVPVRVPEVREVESGVYEIDIAAQEDGRLRSADVSLEHSDFAPVALSFGGQEAGHEHRVVLGVGGRVEGTVVGVRDAVVMVQRDGDGALLAAVPVDSEGRFRAGPFADRNPIVLYVYERTMRNLVALVAVVPRNGVTKTLTIGDPSAPSVSGRALKRGRGAPGTLVALDGKERVVVFAGADGRYRFDGVEPGSYRVFLNYGGGDKVHLTRFVHVGEGPTVVETDARHLIEGVLVDADTNEPITGEKYLDVKGRRVESGGSTGDSDGTRALETGRFRLYVTGPGTWEIDAPDFHVRDKPRVTVRDGIPVSGVRVRVRRDAKDGFIEVAIRDDESKEPVATGSYQFSAGTLSGMGRWKAGRLAFEKAGIEPYTIRIHAPQHVSATVHAPLSRETRRVEERVELVRADSVRIAAVMDGGAAKPAGVKTGDVLLRYGAVRVRNVGELGEAIRAARGTVVLELSREGRPVSITLPAGRMGVRVANHRTR